MNIGYKLFFCPFGDKLIEKNKEKLSKNLLFLIFKSILESYELKKNELKGDGCISLLLDSFSAKNINFLINFI